MSNNLTFNQYGKSNIRLVRVTRHADRHEVSELEVSVKLEGRGLSASYTRADNSLVVPTDTVKNTIYVMAKQHKVDPIEEFGSAICAHFLGMYVHLTVAKVEITQITWQRWVDEEGLPHTHGFMKKGPETRQALVTQVRGGQAVVRSRIADLVVLKTTGSGFEKFHKCKYTTLPEAKDRLMCTSVRCEWTYNTQSVDYNAVYDKVRTTILSRFSNEYSASVQEIVYDVSNRVIALLPAVQDINFQLPNIHVFQYDLEQFGLNNNDEVYMPIDKPSGYIEGTVTRSKL